jgi:hypothetical protein
MNKMAGQVCRCAEKQSRMAGTGLLHCRIRPDPSARPPEDALSGQKALVQRPGSGDRLVKWLVTRGISV